MGEGGRFSSTVTSVNLCSCKLPLTPDPVSSPNETSWVMRGRRTSGRVRRRKRRKKMRRKKKRGKGEGDRKLGGPVGKKGISKSGRVTKEGEWWGC